MIGSQPHPETFHDEDLMQLEDAFAAEPAAARIPLEAGPMPLEAGDPRRVGRYRLTARLGSGGMGVVYLGVADDGRLVAVKVLRPELADHQESRARFGREMAVLTRVRGARIVRVIEADAEGGRPFLATEYAAGPTLAQHVESAGPLDAGMLYGLAAGLAEALAAIHGAGIVHRDLKPGNVILAADGPKVIDFGIAQMLDSAALTRTGTTIGTTGYMAPEQVAGQAGPAADIFAWAVTLTFAASGQPPFGTGPTDAVVYRILHAQPSIAAVPEGLRPVVVAALAKDPRNRPAAHEILDRLAVPPALTWPPTESWAGGPRQTAVNTEADLVEGVRHPGVRRRLARWNVVPVAALVLAGATALALTVTGHATPSRLASAASARPVVTLPAYPGQQGRSVVQTIERIVSYRSTIVATGSQTSDGVVRQQFIVSHDGGKSWRLAPMHAADGGPAPLGYPAVRLAGGSGGWLAVGPQATWTSTDGLSWTLAARHGITPWQPGDDMLVLNSTAQGYIATGTAAAGHGQTQAVIWTSRDGLTWQRETAAQLGLAGPGQTVQVISFGTSFGPDTVISGTVAKGSTKYAGVWLSTDGGSTWTRVSIPAGHGAGTSIAGLGTDASGLIAIRAGRTPSGTQDGVAYFSQNGEFPWQYAATITAPGGWTPKLVKGSDDGFVVTGNSGGQIVPFTSTGRGTAWQQTAPLGPTGQTLLGATVGAGNTVIAIGSTTSQQAMFDEATTSALRPVSLASIPGALIPEAAVNAVAVADGQQIAAGSADGYPTIWRKAGAGRWTLVSSLPLASTGAGPAELKSVTHGAYGWLAVGLTGQTGLTSPIVYTSANGITWQISPTITRDLASSAGHVAAVSATSGPAGYVIVGTTRKDVGGCAADVWFSPNLAKWTRAHDVNDTGGSSTVLTVTADDDGFYSVGSHDGQPALWTTDNGTAWTTTALPLPSGTSGSLNQVAVHGDAMVALGTQTTADVTTALAEVSTNDGQSWHQVPFTPAVPGATVTALTEDAGGFTAAVQSGPDTTIWTTTDGTTWTQVQARGLTGAGTHQLAALAPSGSTVTGIGSTATQQSWQPVFLGLPAR